MRVDPSGLKCDRQRGPQTGKQTVATAWPAVILVGFVAAGCTDLGCNPSHESATEDSANVEGSVERSTSQVSEGEKEANDPAPSDSPVDKTQIATGKTKKKVTLSQLNAGHTYKPDPEDLSPEGFNWLHRDLALIYSGALYKMADGGHYREETLKERRGKLTDYLKTLRSVGRKDFQKWERKHQVPFLINAYHAHLFLEMIDRDFEGLNAKLLKRPDTVKLFDDSYSLQGFVDQELRGHYDDPRIFLSLHCFAPRCPVLRHRVVSFKNLDMWLTQSTFQLLMNEEKTPFDEEAKTLDLPPVVHQQEDLIEAGGESLKDFVARHLKDERKVELLEEGALKLK